jgi:hypothetical protein
MKKIFLFFLFIAFITLSSYTDISNNGGWLNKNEVNAIVDNSEGLIDLHFTSSTQRVKLCPGTGVTCIIKYKDADGDDAVYSSSKGKNKPDIQL